jgi:hypothetical protein
MIESIGPTTREEFVMLPIGPEQGRKVGAYFAADNTIISAVIDDECWMLGKYVDGQWYRKRV